MTRNYDEWTIDRWRLEPRLNGPDQDFDDPADVDPAPPLWKDLTLAAVVALGFWLAAMATLG